MLASVAFQLSILIWPQTFQQYAWVVKYVWMLCGVMWLIWFITHPDLLGRFLTNKTADAPQSTPLQSQIANPTLSANPVINVYPPAPERADVPKYEVQKPESTAVRLEFIQVVVALVQQDAHNTWVALDGHQHTNAVLVEFRNTPKQIGEKTPTARGVVASLSFTADDSGQKLHINHGAWLNEYTHYEDFRSGQTKKLLIAVNGVRVTAGRTTFAAIENPRASNPFASGYGSRQTIKGMRPLDLPSQNGGSVTVTLIDGDGVTVFYGEFKYKITGDDIDLTPRFV
jgi:hypothetical protein